MKKTVLAFGTFDLLHPGHLYYLREAKKQGDKLVVVVARDKTSLKVKKRKPVYSQTDRLQLVKALEFVDQAFLGDEKDYLKHIKKFKPAVIALGYDQEPVVRDLKQKLKTAGLNCSIKRIKAFQKHKHKSSKIKKRIKRAKN